VSTTPEQLPAWDRLEDPAMYDDKGMVKPIATSPEGDTGSNDTPPDPNASKVEGAAEKKADAVEPSPAKPADAAAAKPDAEDKSGKVDATAAATGEGKPPAPGTATGKTAGTEGEEADETLKQKYARPEDKGPEWGIRAYRDLRKIVPVTVQERLTRINSTERVGRGLEFVADFADVEADIGTAWQKMTALSSSRTRELTNFVYENFLEHYPDNVATDLIGEVDPSGNPVRVTAAELKEAYKLVKSGATAGNAQPQSTATTGTGAATAKEPTKPDGMSDDDWENFKVDYAPAYEAWRKETSAAQQPPAPAAKQEDPKVTELANRVQTFEQKELERQQEIERNEILTKGNEFHVQAFSVVEDGLRDLGLNPDPAKDDERTIRLKAETVKSIRETVEAELDGPDGPKGNMDWSLCSDEQKENRRLAVIVMKLLQDKDYTAAFDYIELAQARYQLAFDRVAPTKMELYNAAMGQPSTPNRNVDQGGHKRPEIDGSAGAGGNASNGKSKTPWLDPGFKQPGETVWEAMDRYTTEHGIPGR
jgi:hypothetical protein